jgi:protein ImuB
VLLSDLGSESVLLRPVRVLVAVWPDWPVVAAGYSPDVPAVVVAANRVQAVTAAARAEGVKVGLRRREAQGRCPELIVAAADSGREARAWEPVVAAVEKLTPAVEVLSPGRLSLATRGPSRYFGGDSSLARLVLDKAKEVTGQQGCQIGVADGRFTATRAAIVASEGGQVVVPPGASREWLAPHPVAALGPDFEDFSDLLVRLGIRTLGDLAELPGPAVLGRFGWEGVTARRLAMGLDEGSVQARTPPPDLACSAELDPPEQRVEAAAFVAKALADELQARLDTLGLVATSVAIEVETEHGESLVRHWRHEGALTASALAERTRWQLDGWLTAPCSNGILGRSGPTAGLTLLRLTPEEVRPDRGRQLGFWGGVADADARASRAMARVQGLLGPEAVTTAVLEGGRGFADQVRLVPWGDDRTSPARSTIGGSPAPWPGRLKRPSPALVYQPPRPAELIDSSGDSIEVSGRGAISAVPAALAIEGGLAEPVVLWAGPWPLEERWWERGGRRRARIQVVLQSGEAHVVSRESGRWWIEASYA